MPDNIAGVSSASTNRSSSREAARGQILEIARECFRRDGVRLTTMESIAKAAGTSRQTVYKSFASRLELIGAAVAARISELADDILGRRWDGDGLDEVFVERSSAIVESIRNDPELAGLLGEDSPMTMHQALWQTSVRQRGLRDWLPWLRQARRAGLVRADVTDDDIYEWMQTVLTSIILRPDPDPEHQRVLIDTFLMDSLRPRGE
jgi:AcrR family transcriptional regulator